MKNLAKYLSLFLVLAVLASVFTFAAFADEPAAQAETTVGAYEAPSTAWNPNSEENAATYANIAYGVWASETAFLDGDAPKFWYQNTNSSDTATYVTDAKATGVGVPLTTGNIATTDKTNFKAEYVSADGFVPGYVHVYKDVEITSTSQIFIGANQKLTVCLGGNTLTMNQGWLLGPTGSCPNAALTLKDGIVVYNKGQVQPRTNTTMIWNNLDITTSCQIVYDGGAKLIQYEDCKITFTAEKNFSLGGNSTTEDINFIDTDIIYNVTPTVEVFVITDNWIYAGSKLTVNFDKDCSFSGIPSDKWFGLNEAFYANKYVKDDPATTETNEEVFTTGTEENGKFSKDQTINFEVGAQFKNGAVPPTTLNLYAVDFDACYASALEASRAAGVLKQGTKVTNTVILQSGDKIGEGAGIATINYVDPETDTPLTGDWYLVYDEATDSYSVKANLIGYSAVILDETGKVVSKAWTGDNITIAADDLDVDAIVFLNSETGEPDEAERYFLFNETNNVYTVINTLSGYTLIETDASGKIIYKTWTETTISSGNASTPITTRNGVTLKLLDNITFTHISTYLDYDLTIDLNGHTFTRNTTGGFGNFQLGNNCSASWMPNRDVYFISSADKRGTLDFTPASYGSAIQARPGTNVYFENVDILTGKTSLFNDGGAQLVSIKNCSITGTGTNIAGTSGVGANAGNHARSYILDNVTLDKIGGFQAYASIKDTNFTFTVKNGCVIDSTYPLIAVIDTGWADTLTTMPARKLNIDIDTKFTTGGSLVSLAANASTIHSVNLNYYEDITDAANPGTPISTENLILLSDGGYYLVKDRDNLGGVDVAYLVGAAGAIPSAVLATYNDEDVAILTCEAIRALPAGSTITFLRDLVYDATGSPNADKRIASYRNNLTFDFNQFTFTFDVRFTMERSVTIKNGNIKYVGSTQPFFGNPGATAVINFENLNIDTTEATCNQVFNLYQGNVYLTDCYVDTRNGDTRDIIFVHGTDVNTVNAVLTRVEAYCSNFISEGINTTKGIYSNYKIIDCTAHTNGYALFTVGSSANLADAADFYVNIEVSDTDVEGALADVSTKITAPIVNITVADSQFANKPVANSVNTNLTFAEGQSLVGVNDAWHVQSYKPTVGAHLQVNLSLSTDFNVNFFATPEVVVGVYLNGALLPASEWDGSVKYTATFAAHQAADALAFEVWVKEGEVTYKLTLNYSVLTYANKLTATDGVSQGAKDLAEAAIAYVKEAYNVANIELPAELAAFATDITASAEGTLPEQLTDAVASIRFELASSVNLIVTIDNNYAGNTIVVNGKVYNVAAGDVVTVEMKAKDLAGEISVSAGNETAVFTLAGYVNSTSVQGTDMEALVEALYTYCFYAKAYAESPDGAELK